MNKSTTTLLASLTVLTTIGAISTASGEPQPSSSLTELLQNGKVNLDVRLRFEQVDQDNALADAEALTLRTFLGYTTADFKGWSAKIELEDSRIVAGIDDYSVGPTNFHPGEFSVIADPETTELDQAYLQYKKRGFTAKLGRQVITYDNHRFIGHVGWRQDRQTFDAVTLNYQASSTLSLSYNFLDRRERIFADDADVDARDHLLNIAWQTTVGTVSGYTYLLKDQETGIEIDTYGLRFNGAKEVKHRMRLLYTLEIATQSFEQGTTDYDANYYQLSVGAEVSGITVKAGYEMLGSDNAQYGVSTPLATLHAHNGWADQFLSTPATGLIDRSLSLGGSLAGGKFTVVYHDFDTDERTPAIDELGDEFGLLYTRKFGEHYSAGIKYATFSADDYAVDTDKLWVWFGLSF